MADDLTKISAEDINRLERVLEKAADLTARQEEIIETILTGETRVGEKRISYLQEYFDIYSKNLDTVARKTSNLSDDFLILEKQAGQIRKNFAAASSEPSSPKEPPTTGGGNKKTRSADKNDSSIDERRVNALNEPMEDEGKKFAERLTAMLEDGSRLLAKDKDKAKIEAEIKKRTEAHLEKQKKLTSELYETEMALSVLKINSAKEQEYALTELIITAKNEAGQAKLNYENTLLAYNAQAAFDNQEYIVDAAGNSLNYNLAGQLREEQSGVEDDTKALEELAKRRAKFIEEEELKAKIANGGKLDKIAATRIRKEANLEFTAKKEILEKIKKEQQKEEARNKREEAKAEAERQQAKGQELVDTVFGAGHTLKDRMVAWKDLTTDENGDTRPERIAAVLVKGVSDELKKLNESIDKIAGYKSFIDTRLQGSNNKTYLGSYWDQLTKDMTSIGAVNPFFKQETFAENIKSLVDKGIAFNITQRAFLQTITDKIAATFNVADSTLLRLVRIQQEDSTAGRLGMEAALNAFLNNMYENTEYLKEVATGVRTSLEEMQSLMQGAEAAEVEYQVQKWLGSLYSVGMSQPAVNSISTALGQIAAGQIEGLTSGGAGNLLIMAANDAGIPIADILTKGITAEETNVLLQAAVNYLAELADSAADNKVVQQQLANVFGVKASDLKAATNLVLPGSVGSVTKSSLTYENMLKQLDKMAGSMASRTSLGEMLTNIWENGKYTLAGGISSSPLGYLVYKLAGLLDATVGGIPFPDLSFAGSGVALNTTIADLMRVGSVGVGMLSSLAPMLSGLANSFSGQAMLKKLGISSGAGLTVTPRGGGIDLLGSTGGGSQTVSESGYVGNASGNDVKNSTMAEANDSNKKQMVEAMEDTEKNQIDLINGTVIKIYELLDDVVHGGSSFKVRLDNYGLSSSGSSSSGVGVGHSTNNKSNLGGWTVTI